PPGGPVGAAPPGGVYAGGPGAPPPGGGAPKGKSKVPLIAGGVVGGGALLGGLIFAVASLGGGGAPLPMEKNKLPKDTMRVSRSKSTFHQLGGEDLPEQARWSHFASEFCGGRNMFSSFMDLDQDMSRKLLARAIAGGEVLGEIKTALECGKAVAGKYDYSTPRYRLKVGEQDDDDTYGVTVLTLDLEKLPDGSKLRKTADDPDNMTEAYCNVYSFDADKDCDDKSSIYAHLKDTKLWVKGSQQSMDEFGGDISPEGDHESEDLDLLESISAEFKSYEFASASIDLSKDYSEPLFGSMGGSIISKADKDDREDLDDKRDELKEEMEDAKGYGFGRTGTFYTGTNVEYHVVVYTDEGKAEKIASAYTDYLHELGKAIEAGIDADDDDDDDDDDDKKKKKLSERQKERRELHAKIDKSIAEESAKALEAAEAKASGDKVEITIEVAIPDGLKEDVKKLHEDEMELAKAAAKLVDNLLAEEDLDETALAELGGDDMVDTLKDTKKLASECKDPCDECDDEDKCMQSCLRNFEDWIGECEDEVESFIGCLKDKQGKDACNKSGNLKTFDFKTCREPSNELSKCKDKVRLKNWEEDHETITLSEHDFKLPGGTECKPASLPKMKKCEYKGLFYLFLKDFVELLNPDWTLSFKKDDIYEAKRGSERFIISLHKLKGDNDSSELIYTFK
ncbi:MAG: hypothetical protein AAGA56_15335, partial [Myxococcota bacterium]